MPIQSKIPGRKVATNPAAPVKQSNYTAAQLISALRCEGLLPPEAEAPNVVLTVVHKPGLAALDGKIVTATFRPLLAAKKPRKK
jgi:hypothetical protein